MNTSLHTRWKQASTATLLIKPELAGTVRMLGKIDADLNDQNTSFRALRSDIGSITPAQWEVIYDAAALSQLWILGAYELVRTLHQALRTTHSLSVNAEERCGSLKRSFERLRMPIAKLEPPARHHQDDYGVAYPALSAAQGLVWKVADNALISRDDLGLELLEFLECARAELREA